MNDGLPRDYDEWRTREPFPHMKSKYSCMCEECDEPIFCGETFYNVSGLNYCLCCIDRYVKSTDKCEICEICEEEIPYDELAYNIHGGWVCMDCMQNECRKVEEDD